MRAFDPSPPHLICALPTEPALQCALTDLDLSAATTDAGGTRIARALHNNSSLTRLSLAYTRLATTGGIAFAEALRANTTLTHANIAGNALTDAAAVAIAAAISGNQVRT